jgi:putative oxidoreductase
MSRPLGAFLFGTRDTSPLPVELALLALRVFAGLSMALAHGFGKLPPPEKLVGGVAALGFPVPVAFAWAAALAEAVGGVLLAAGFLTRPAALSIAITMAVAGFAVHAADPFRVKELALLFLVTALVFAARGGGRFSLDRLVGGGR